MEKFLITRHGHWGCDSIPDEAQYAKIGMDRTSTGKSAMYAWGLRNACTPVELADFIHNNLRLFAGSVFRLEAQGRDLIIKTIVPGAWIGTGGRWVKGMTACLKNSGRAIIREIPHVWGNSSYPFIFRYAKGWEIVFWDKVFGRIIGNERKISTDNSHNYIGDIWGLDMPQTEFDRLHKLAQAINESAKLRCERKREQSEKIAAQIKAECPNIYFGQDWEIINYPMEWLEWCKKIAAALSNVNESANEGVTPHKLRLGIYQDHIYIGGTCSTDNPTDKKMVEETRGIISHLGGDVVPYKENYPGQFLIVRK